jgi:predicted RNase H-like HicB family nuclease
MNNKISYPIIVEVDEDGIFIVNCPSIKGCRSYGSTIDEAMDNIREAIESCIDDISPNLNKYIGIREISVTKKIPQYA